MAGVDDSMNKVLDQIRNKFWDFPAQPDEMRITSYDGNDNPLIIEYYRDGALLFIHDLTYDGSGRLTVKLLKRKSWEYSFFQKINTLINQGTLLHNRISRRCLPTR